MNTFAWLHIDFMQKALLGSIAISIASSLLGIFVLSRRIVFISMALAEVSSAAVALGSWLGLDPTVTAVLITLSCSFILAFTQTKPSRFPNETNIAIMYLFASSLAILLIAKNPAGEVDLLNVLFGNILTVNKTQLLESLLVSVVCLACCGLFFKSIFFTSFDYEMAKAIGVNTLLWTVLFYFLLGFQIVTSIRLSGALLSFAYLVIPAYCGLRLANSMRNVVITSLLIGPISTFVGLWFSFNFDLPTGASMTAALVIAALLSIFTHHIRERK